MLHRGGPRTRIGVAEGGAAESPARPPLPVLEASPPGLRTSAALPAAARPAGRALHAPASTAVCLTSGPWRVPALRSAGPHPRAPLGCPPGSLSTFQPNYASCSPFLLPHPRAHVHGQVCTEPPGAGTALVSLTALLQPLEQRLPLLLQHTVSLMPFLSGPFTPILMAQSAPPPQVSSPPRLCPTQVSLGTVPASGQHRGVWGPALWPG